MAAATKKETVTMKPIKIDHVKVRIVGDSPLIVHAWSEKAKREMLEAQTGPKKKIKKHPAKMPFDDFARALYWLTPMPTEVIKDPSTQEDRDVVTEELFDEAIDRILSSKYDVEVSVNVKSNGKENESAGCTEANQTVSLR